MSWNTIYKYYSTIYDINVWNLMIMANVCVCEMTITINKCVW